MQTDYKTYYSKLQNGEKLTDDELLALRDKVDKAIDELAGLGPVFSLAVRELCYILNKCNQLIQYRKSF